MASLAIEGRNCWCRPRARRVACIIDAAAYFEHLHHAIEQATRSIYIVGWDIDSRVPLLPRGSPDRLPQPLGSMLSALVSRRPDLHAYVLSWDFSFLFAHEREPLPVLHMGWRTHTRVHFRLDSRVPTGGSLHQKIVVIDERLAFVGGIDLCNRRWDTPEHRVGDPRRVDHLGQPYRPHHDLQVAMDGAAARTIAHYVRRRWQLVTGQRLDPAHGDSDPWPAGLVPDFTDIRVALARTEPGHDGRSGCREVEQLYIDCIDGAKRRLYIENPYFTSRRLADALATRLREQRPPEVVIVGPRYDHAWLERATLGVLRGRVADRLRRADHAERLAVFWAAVPGLDGLPVDVNVHGKVMVVDDRALRIGSANMTNRSMGVDIELDVLIESDGDPEVVTGISAIRDRLVAEHLGVPPDQVAQSLARTGSLLATIGALRGGPRTLVDALDELVATGKRFVPDEALVDPESPLGARDLIRLVVPEPNPAKRRALRRKLGLLATLVGIAALATSATALGIIDTSGAVARLTELRGELMAPFVLVAAFVVGGLVLVPVTLMIATAGMLFGPWLGAAYGLLGAMVGAVVYWAIGRWLGVQVVRSMTGPRLATLAEILRRKGLFAVAAVRTLPIAPHVVVGMVSGAFGISLRSYTIGTLIAMTPGTVILAALGDRIGSSMRDPTIGHIGWTIVLAVAVLLVAAVMQHWLDQKMRTSADASPAVDHFGHERS